MNESIALHELIGQWLKDHPILKYHFAYGHTPAIYISHISVCGNWCVSVFSNSVALWSKDVSWGVGGWIDPYDPKIFDRLEREMLKSINPECEKCNELSL